MDLKVPEFQLDSSDEPAQATEASSASAKQEPSASINQDNYCTAASYREKRNTKKPTSLHVPAASSASDDEGTLADSLDDEDEEMFATPKGKNKKQPEASRKKQAQPKTPVSTAKAPSTKKAKTTPKATTSKASKSQLETPDSSPKSDQS